MRIVQQRLGQMVRCDSFFPIAENDNSRYLDTRGICRGLWTAQQNR